MKIDSLFALRPVSAKKADTSILVSMVLLFGLGFVTLYVSSAAYGLRIFDNPLYFVRRQFFYFAFGSIFFALSAWINLDFIRSHIIAFVVGTLVLCCLTFVPFLGVERNGASRWIALPLGYTFQPSEFAKIAIIFFLANLLDKKKDRLNDVKATICPCAIGIVLFAAVIFAQNDFSTGIFVVCLAAALLFIGGIPIHWFVSILVIMIPVGFLFVFTKEYRVNRLIAFLNPSFDKNGANYQVAMSEKAISSGSFLGKGMTGVENVQAIPEVQADFVFAGWIEGMGFLGLLIYLTILGVLAYKGFKIALECKEVYRSLIAFGCTIILLMQSCMNIGVVSGALPATGIPLPFFSAGGTSMVVTMLLCGLLLNIAKYEQKGELYE